MENFRVNHLEWLRNGSEFHRATPVRGGRGFSITPANDTPDMHGGYKYDFAIIIPDE